MSQNKQLFDIQREIIPSVLSYDLNKKDYIIGESAKAAGIKGKTNAYSFKELLGASDAEYLKENRYWIVPTGKTKDFVSVLSARDTAKIFFEKILQQISRPAKLIIGVPAITDETWLGNYRRHIKEIFSELKREPPTFFYEPMAIYLHYLGNIENTIEANGSKTALILDIGGATFNSLIVRTTKEGHLSTRGLGSKPLGIRAEFCGGLVIDKILLKILVDKVRKSKIVFKDDPINRCQTSAGSCILPIIEQAKIKISQNFNRDDSSIGNYEHICEKIIFPKGSLHLEQEITVDLTGDDLKSAILNVWKKTWSKLIFDTIRDATATSARLKSELDKFDNVLVAGGSSKLPFFKEQLVRCIKQYINPKNIKISDDPGYAIAEGIALHAKEHSRRDPKLKTHTIWPCFLSDLYIQIQKDRASPWESPKLIENKIILENGRLISSPHEVQNNSVDIEIKSSFKISHSLHYRFLTEPPNEKSIQDGIIYENVVKIPNQLKTVGKLLLNLNINDDSSINIAFKFKGKGGAARKNWIKIECKELHLDDFHVSEGDIYVGFDFGNCNSYLDRKLEIEPDKPDFSFPAFQYSNSIRRKLREFEKRIEILRKEEVLTKQNIFMQANKQILAAVFHSNKIEGIKLTHGQTMTVFSISDRSKLDEEQLIAKNLQEAYKWVINNPSDYKIQAENYIRNINRLILKDVNPDCGKYRTKVVNISGTEWSPPAPIDIPPLMEELSKEIANGPENRSILEFAASNHAKLVTIHPFVDGNGRTARLLLCAILLSHEMPAIIVRYDDRSRYLDALGKSNSGQIGELLGLFLNLCDAELNDLDKLHKENIGENSVSTTTLKSKTPDKPDLSTLDLNKSDDPLYEILKIKTESDEATFSVKYEAWNQVYMNLLEEFKNFSNEIYSNPKYQNFNIVITITEFPIITLESFCDMCMQKQLKETWLFEIIIGLDVSQERFMFSFDKVTHCDPYQNIPIALYVSRHSNGEWIRLSNEPIIPKIIYYKNNLLEIDEKEVKNDNETLYKIANRFVAEVVRTYLI